MFIDQAYHPYSAPGGAMFPLSNATRPRFAPPGARRLLELALYKR
jgi:hypothetical protein